MNVLKMLTRRDSQKKQKCPDNTTVLWRAEQSHAPRPALPGAAAGQHGAARWTGGLLQTQCMQEHLLVAKLGLCDIHGDEKINV